jgi:hypothetical protein
MGQFRTGMMSVWTCCAKLADVNAARAIIAATCNSIELNLENVERRN